MSSLLRVNWILAALAATLLLAAGLIAVWPSSDLPPPAVNGKNGRTLTRPFAQPEETLANLGDTVFALEFSAPTLQLPDLSKHLTYYGRNKRPDAQASEQHALFIALRSVGGTLDIKSVEPGQQLYLVYQKNGRRGNYELSPENAETGLWFEVFTKEKPEELRVMVSMLDQNGELVTRPPELREVTLTERPLPRYGTGRWELDGERVDSSLLTRQKGRWEGQDQFLIDHGGETYAAEAAKQRITFEKDGERYSVRLGSGDYLVWKEGRWRNVDSQTEPTAGLPLLSIKQIEDRSLNCDLWDAEGKSVVSARLSKTVPQWKLSFLQKDVRFAGARTRTSLNLDVAAERIVTQPDDWFLLVNNEELKKIDTVDLLDAYLADKLRGQLLVIEGVDKEEGQPVLKAHIYSEGRSQKKPVTFRTTEPFVVIGGIQTPPPAVPTPPVVPSKEPAVLPVDVIKAPKEEVPEAILPSDTSTDTPIDLPQEIDPEDIRKRWEEFRKEGSPTRKPLDRNLRSENKEGMRYIEEQQAQADAAHEKTFQIRKGRLIPNR